MSEKNFKNFIEQIIEADLEAGTHKGTVKTRFPPEPNGYLHIGHAKSIFINFENSIQYNGTCNLRFDDTNPVKEDVEFVNSIKNDIQWLGYQWDDLFFASNYFPKMYDFAIQLIKKGLAFVCDLSPEESRDYKGDYNVDGRPSPYRNRTVEENLDLFARMRNGEFADGEKTLKAKIDFNHPNMNMRDPVIYRIHHQTHHNTGDEWCIYPMYDFAHPLEDAIEGITHSICTLEFEANRPLYDWYLENLKENFDHLPHQYEFAKLSITDTIMGKRYLRELVENGKVIGWDDPRMPTLSGLRRRGVRPSAIKDFIKASGVSKANSQIDMPMFEHHIREDLANDVPAVMAVLDPIKVVIENFDEDRVEYVEGKLHPKNDEFGVRQIPFTREVYIEREDFCENPPKGYKRLSPGVEVRLRHAYFIKCNDVIKDENGNIVELRCTYDEQTKSGSGFKGRKPNGTIHWVSATKNTQTDVNMYGYLAKLDDSKYVFNEDSCTVYDKAVVEEFVGTAEYERYQFIRHGFFKDDKLYDKRTFNSIVGLKSR